MSLEDQTQTKEIGGVSYKVTPVPFGQGRPALVRLMKVVAPMVASFLEGVESARGNSKEYIEMVGAGRVMGMLPAVLSDEDVSYFAKTFGPASAFKEDGKWIPLTVEIQESHFAGKYLEFMQWIGFSIQVNYGNFFSGVMSGGSLGAFRQIIQTPASK